MADELDVLLEKVDDPALRADLRAEIDRVKAKRSFGLVFESHLPERVRLPEHPVRRGVRVVHRDTDGEPRLVRRVQNGSAVLVGSDGSTEEVDVSDLVVVAEFGEPTYPGLERLGSRRLRSVGPGSPSLVRNSAALRVRSQRTSPTSSATPARSSAASRRASARTTSRTR